MISYINTKNFRYLNIDGKFYISLEIEKLKYDMDLDIFLNMISKFSNINITYIIEQMDKQVFKRNIVMKIGNNSVEIEKIKLSQINYHTIRKYNSELLELKENVTTNNNNIYLLSMFIIVSDYSFEKVNNKMKVISNILFTNNILSKRMNFNHLSGVKMMLPNNIRNNEKMYITSDGLNIAYPFIKNGIDDEFGIFLGMSNNKNILIDFNNFMYKNTNGLILGSSGTGKSYFMKSIILKNISRDYIQIVFDVEGEYTNILKMLNREFRIIKISSKKNKSVIKSGNTENEYFHIDKKITKAINSNNSIVLDFSELSNEENNKTFNLVLNSLKKHINNKSRRKKILIYIDEIWKYINGNNNNEEEIINIFKTIRKRNGAIIVATQEINDIYNSNNIILGKAILNNTNFKFIFSHKFIDDEIIKIMNMQYFSINKIQSLPKGMCVAQIEDKTLLLEVKTFDFERKIINGEQSKK